MPQMIRTAAEAADAIQRHRSCVPRQPDEAWRYTVPA